MAWKELLSPGEPMLSPFKILCAIGLLAVFSSTISKNPSLPLLVTHLGGDQIAVGVVAGFSAFTGVLLSLPAGYLSDRIGRHRMLLLSGAVFATAPFLYLLASDIWQVGVILAFYASGNVLGYTALYIVCGLTGLTALLAMFLLPGKKRIPEHNSSKSAWEIGLCISSQIITIAILKPVLGRFSDRHGRPLQIIWGAFLAGTCMVILAFSFSFPALIISSIFLRLSISVVTSASAAHIADPSKRGGHGSAMGMLGSIMDIGHTTGAMVGGILAVSFGLTASFLSGCVVLMLSAFCFMLLQQKQTTFPL